MARGCVLLVVAGESAVHPVLACFRLSLPAYIPHLFKNSAILVTSQRRVGSASFRVRAPIAQLSLPRPRTNSSLLRLMT